jgi:hypothetical protein
MNHGANPAAVQPATPTRASRPRSNRHLAPGYLRAEVDRLAFGLPESAPAPLAAMLLQPGVPGTTKAGTPGRKPQEIPAWKLERETGFEPATLSLGS